jgi:hypothetical protein
MTHPDYSYQDHSAYYAVPEARRPQPPMSAYPGLRQGVKIEAPGSPDIPPGISAQAYRYPIAHQQHYPGQSRMSTAQLLEHYSQPHAAYSQPPPSSSFSFMAGANPWPVSSPAPNASQQHIPLPPSTPSLPQPSAYTSASAMVLPQITTIDDGHRVPSDEYDEPDDMGERYSPVGPGSGPSSGKKGDKEVRRRSSKGPSFLHFYPRVNFVTDRSAACDQCRKSKCKCERTSPNEPCKNCVMLNMPCTFLGPSRKRGPPKGYIDAIEARLHQTEALIGILLDSGDPRARSLFDDLSEVTRFPLSVAQGGES